MPFMFMKEKKKKKKVSFDLLQFSKDETFEGECM